MSSWEYVSSDRFSHTIVSVWGGGGGWGGLSRGPSFIWLDMSQIKTSFLNEPPRWLASLLSSEKYSHAELWVLKAWITPHFMFEILSGNIVAKLKVPGIPRRAGAFCVCVCVSGGNLVSHKSPFSSQKKPFQFLFQQSQMMVHPGWVNAADKTPGLPWLVSWPVCHWQCTGLSPARWSPRKLQYSGEICW